MALGACEAPLRALTHAWTLSRRPTSLAIGTFRLSALHRGISRPGRLPSKARSLRRGARSARGGGHEPRRRETAPGSAFRTVSRRRPSMSRDAVGLTSYRNVVKGRRPKPLQNGGFWSCAWEDSLWTTRFDWSATPMWRRWFAKRTESSTHAARTSARRRFIAVQRSWSCRLLRARLR